MSKYFFCYSERMSNFIMSKGVSYITQAKHKETDKVFTLFERSDQLELVINEYEKLRNK